MKRYIGSGTFTLILGAFLAFCVLSQSLQVIAKDAPTYVPPQRGRRAQRTEGAGARGNCPKNISILLLAPSDHVGQTSLGHPSFLWHVSSIDVPIRFTLTEPKVAEPLVDLVVPIAQPGIFRFSLPKTSQELVPNQEYRWTVSAICNPQRPSSNIFAYANIVRVPSSKDLEQQLSTRNEISDRAQLYATSGLWYDAIDTAYSFYQTHEDRLLTSSLFWGLLETVGINGEMRFSSWLQP